MSLCGSLGSMPHGPEGHLRASCVATLRLTRCLLQRQRPPILTATVSPRLHQHSVSSFPLPRLGDDPTMRLFTNPRMFSKVKGSHTGFGGAPLARAIRPEGDPPPLRILDGTAGLGGTAIRLSETFGASCEVTAVEASAPLACLLDYGLRGLAVQKTAWAAAAGRIRVEHADVTDYLARNFGENPTLPRPCVVYLNPCLDVKRARKRRPCAFVAQSNTFVSEREPWPLCHANGVLRGWGVGGQWPRGGSSPSGS